MPAVAPAGSRRRPKPSESPRLPAYADTVVPGGLVARSVRLERAPFTSPLAIGGRTSFSAMGQPTALESWALLLGAVVLDPLMRGVDVLVDDSGW